MAYDWLYSETPAVFYKKAVLKNTSLGVSFLIKLQAFRSATLLKIDSNSDVFI